MRPSRRDILIATRKSRLATAQSQAIGLQIHQYNPRVAVQLLPMESEGDRVVDHPLAAMGGKGLFTRSIEEALLSGKADIAVHSMKDLPTEPTPGLVIAAIPMRMPAHDVLITRHGSTIEDLPLGATLGTCSPRRAAQLLKVRPDLKIELMRGNVETRLRKVLEEKRFDATLLAAAGLLRLDLEAYARNPVSVDWVLPAAGQGALAVQCRCDDHTSLRRCMPLNDPITSQIVTAERQVVADLGADCHSPIAAYAELVGFNQIRIRVRVLSINGVNCLEADKTSSLKHTRKLCSTIAHDLLQQGAAQLLREAKIAGQSQSPVTHAPKVPA